MAEKSKKNEEHPPSLNGTSIVLILEEKMNGVKENSGRFSPDNIFSLIDDEDLCDDAVTEAFRRDGGPEGVVKILALPENMAHPILASRLQKYKTILASDLRNNYRYSYMALQNFLDKNNDAAKLERIASKQDDKSAGYWLPVAPSFHSGQWAYPGYIIDSGRLDYNVD